jgi:hypothetical protein
LLEMMQRRPGRPAASVRPSIFVRSREAGAVASARSSAADSWRPRCPPPAGQQGDRSPTFSRRSSSSPLSIRSTHQRTRGARLAGFDFGRDAFSTWPRSRPRRRPGHSAGSTSDAWNPPFGPRDFTAQSRGTMRFWRPGRLLLAGMAKSSS